MEKLGGQPIDVERSLLQPGDVVVVPESGTFTSLPPGSVGWVEQLGCTPSSWMNLMGGTTNGLAGFYGANWGPVPFNFGKLPSQYYDLVRVFSRVQFDTKPANPREVQAGNLPSFTTISTSIKGDSSIPVNSEAMTRIQLATRFENEGKIEEAIQYYRQALNMDSNNPVVLNDLAWILAATSRPELRNGEEAVHLAARAVVLTQSRLPIVIGTLAAAYAQAGQFPQACEMAQTARALAWVTGQSEIAANNLKLLSLYSSGKTVDATYAP
jgi:tetratricopeptide (TPR) repeat protein